jgi:uroporphyrinogen-III synthase
MENALPIRILSTRALGNAARDFIHHENWLVDITSFTETHGVITVDQLADFLAECKEPGKNFLLLFSSENSVKWLKWGLDRYGYKLPPGLKAFCVGKKTLRSAEDMLEVEPILAEKNSETLVTTLKETVPLGITFLYCCGSKRLDTLPLGLKAAGFVVKEYIVYKTELTPHKTFRDYNVILFFSPSAVVSYFGVNNWDKEMVAVSIGHTTSEALKKAGVGTILIADEPNELAMLGKLHDFLKN